MSDVDELLDGLVSALRSGEPVEELIEETPLPPASVRAGYDTGDVDGLLGHVRRLAPEPAPTWSAAPHQREPVAARLTTRVERERRPPQRAVEEPADAEPEGWILRLFTST